MILNTGRPKISHSNVSIEAVNESVGETPGTSNIYESKPLRPFNLCAIPYITRSCVPYDSIKNK